MVYFFFFLLVGVFVVLTLRLLDLQVSSSAGEWRVIARFNSREMAHLAGNILKNEDIETIVEEDWATGIYNRLEFGGNKIRVSPDNMRKAIEILSETRFRKNLETTGEK